MLSPKVMSTTFADRLLLAKNPNTPPHILDALYALYTIEGYSYKDNHAIRHWISMNPNTPVTTLEKLLREEYYITHDCIARNPNAPAYILDELAEVGNHITCMFIAQHYNTLATALEKIAERSDTGYYVFNLIIKHPNVTQRIKNYLMAKIYVNNI